jgi:hypothetical protein
MSDLTPLRIVQMYNDDVWGRHRRELIVELLANPLRRHHPGHTEIFTHDDMLRRYDNYFSKYREMRAVARRYVCEDAYVTLLWDIDMVANDGKVATISGIEMFKVVDGKITDVWNPNAVAAVSGGSLAGLYPVERPRDGSLRADSGPSEVIRHLRGPVGGPVGRQTLAIERNDGVEAEDEILVRVQLDARDDLELVNLVALNLITADLVDQYRHPTAGAIFAADGVVEAVQVTVVGVGVKAQVDVSG